MTHTRLRLPSVKKITDALRDVREEIRGYGDCPETDVRLQVEADGSWAVRSGDSSYDQDHSGYWGSSCVQADDTVKSLRSTAADLIEQAADHAAQCGEDV